MSPEFTAGLIVAAVGALGIGLGGSFVWLDWRAARAHRRALAAAVGGREDAAHRIHGTQAGRPWQLRVLQRHRQRDQIELVVLARVGLTLAVHRRDPVDRTAAAMGLVSACDTGDRAFDAALMVLGVDDSAATRAAVAHQLPAATRTALRRLLDAQGDHWIWSAEEQAIVVRWTLDSEAGTDAAKALEFVALATAASPPPAPGRAWSRSHGTQPGSAGRGITIAVLVVLSLFGFGGFAAMAMDASYPPLERGPLLAVATALAVGLSAAWGWWTRRIAGRQPTDHRAWLPMMVVAPVSFWVTCYAALLGLNGAADDAAPSVVQGRIKAIERVAGDDTADYLLRTGAGPVRVSLPANLPARVGDRIRVRTHPGRLGVAWRHPDRDVEALPAR